MISTRWQPGGTEKLTYLTPAPWGFYVWSLIDLLLIGTVVVQFFDAGSEAVVEGLGFNFAIIGLLNAGWVWLFHHGHHIIGFIVVILLTLAVSATYWKLKTQNPPKTGIAAVFVHLPFCESTTDGLSPEPSFSKACLARQCVLI